MTDILSEDVGGAGIASEPTTNTTGLVGPILPIKVGNVDKKLFRRIMKTDKKKTTITEMFAIDADIISCNQYSAAIFLIK